jgi:hypothetical protein
MYLVKRLCDLTLQETTAHFGVESYGVVGWACAQVRAKQTTDLRFKKTGVNINSSTKNLTSLSVISPL